MGRSLSQLRINAIIKKIWTMLELSAITLDVFAPIPVKASRPPARLEPQHPMIPVLEALIVAKRPDPAAIVTPARFFIHSRGRRSKKIIKLSKMAIPIAIVRKNWPRVRLYIFERSNPLVMLIENIGVDRKSVTFNGAKVWLISSIGM